MTCRSKITNDGIFVTETDKSGRITCAACFPIIEHPVLQKQRWFEVRQGLARSIGSSRADDIVGSAIARLKRIRPKAKAKQLKFGDNDE